MRIELIENLEQLSKNENNAPNSYQDAVNNPELRSTLVFLILNDIRHFKAVQNQRLTSKGTVLPYINSEALLTRLTAYVDLIDMNHIIVNNQNKDTDQSDQEDPLAN